MGIRRQNYVIKVVIIALKSALDSELAEGLEERQTSLR